VRGDLHVDDHHTAEDCALVLGEALDAGRSAIGPGFDALVTHSRRSTRPSLERWWIFSGRAAQRREPRIRSVIAVGDLSVRDDPARHSLVWRRLRPRTIHVDVIKGENDHHRAEAAFKALALALRHALARDDHR
jgi:imidazoleglycerol-phosphate dehydratase